MGKCHDLDLSVLFSWWCLSLVTAVSVALDLFWDFDEKTLNFSVGLQDEYHSIISWEIFLVEFVFIFRSFSLALYKWKFSPEQIF